MSIAHFVATVQFLRNNYGPSHLPTVAKTTVRDPPRANGRTLAHCPPSSEWGPVGDTREIKAARRGTGHPTSKADGSRQRSSLTGTPQRTDRIWDLPLPLDQYMEYVHYITYNHVIN